MAEERERSSGHPRTSACVCCRYGRMDERTSPYPTDSQSASLSWNKARIRGLRPEFYYYQPVAGLLILGVSLTRGRVCRLELLLVLASAVILQSESLRTHDHILLSQFETSLFVVRVTVEVFDPASTREISLPILLCPLIILPHGAQGKHSLLLWEIRVYCSVTYRWMSFYCWQRNFGNVFTELLSSNRHMSHNIYIYIYTYIWKGISKSAVIPTSGSPGLRFDLLMAGRVIFFSLQICSCKLGKN
jgi:hypothetical protein